MLLYPSVMFITFCFLISISTSSFRTCRNQHGRHTLHQIDDVAGIAHGPQSLPDVLGASRVCRRQSFRRVAPEFSWALVPAEPPRLASLTSNVVRSCQRPLSKASRTSAPGASDLRLRSVRASGSPVSRTLLPPMENHSHSAERQEVDLSVGLTDKSAALRRAWPSIG